MLDRILFISGETQLGRFVHHSLAAEGYEVRAFLSPAKAQESLEAAESHLVIINGIGRSNRWLAQACQIAWDTPAIVLTEGREDPPLVVGQYELALPLAFQDILLLVQDLLYQRTLVGHRPFQLSAAVIEKIEAILTTLREDLRARCIVLSTSSGRLIKTVGMLERSVAISLAALMSGSFTAAAKAAQLLGQGEMFDTNLQESEGYGLYGIRLQNRLVLSVAFSAQITIGMVRHYAAQAAIDILEILAREAKNVDSAEDFELDADFRQTVERALGNMLGD